MKLIVSQIQNPQLFQISNLIRQGIQLVSAQVKFSQPGEPANRTWKRLKPAILCPQFHKLTQFPYGIRHPRERIVADIQVTQPPQFPE